MSPIEFEAQEPTGRSSGAQQKKPRRGSFAAFLALLLALAALAGTAWMWWQDESSSGQRESRVLAEIARLDGSDSELALRLRQLRDQLDALAATDGGEQLAELERRLAADRAQLEQAERAIREQTTLAQSLQAANASMHDRLLAAEAALTASAPRQPDAGGELDLAEVDYLLRLASERLQLFADPPAADHALEVADQHLAAMDNPSLLAVRQDISAARRALAAVDLPNYLDVAAQLDAIQSAMAELPFRGGRATGEAAAPAAEEGWWARLKGVFASLVTVRRSTDEEFSKVSLEDKDYVRQRVWLQLEIAHLSLMRRDQQAFRSAVGRVRESVDTWFDPADSRVQSLGSELADLAELEVEVALPDISAPWSTLRGIRAAGPVARPAAAPAAAPPPAGEAPAESGDAPAETGRGDQEDA